MDTSPLLSNVIRYIVGFSIAYFIGMQLLRYFIEPETFYIERFRRKSAYTTHRELLVRAFVGLGLICPVSVTLGYDNHRIGIVSSDSVADTIDFLGVGDGSGELRVLQITQIPKVECGGIGIQESRS